MTDSTTYDSLSSFRNLYLHLTARGKMTLATIKRVHELPGGAAAAGAEVLLSGELWQIVLEYLEQDVDRDAAFGGPGVNGASSKRIAVCLQLSSDSSISTRTRQGAVSSLVCWAAKDDSPQDQRGVSRIPETPANITRDSRFA